MKMHLTIYVVVLCVCTGTITSQDADDWSLEARSLTAGAAGEDVVLHVIEKIENSSAFPSTHQFLRRIAYVETWYGQDEGVYSNDSYHGGIWNVGQSQFIETQNTTRYPKLNRKHKQIERQFGISWRQIQWTGLRKPLLSGIAAMLYFNNVVNKNIPQSICQQADYWTTYYSSNETTDMFYKDICCNPVIQCPTHTPDTVPTEPEPPTDTKQCYTSSDCSNSVVSGVTAHRECCVDTDDGLSWGSSNGDCQPCIVHGFNQTTFNALRSDLIFGFSFFVKGASMVAPVNMKGSIAARTNAGVLLLNVSTDTVTLSNSAIFKVPSPSTISHPTNTVISLHFSPTQSSLIPQIEQVGHFIRDKATIEIAVPPVLVNDTLTEDALMTVPILTDEDVAPGDEIISLCYEVHGQADYVFNLVSDTCVTVNAHYAKAPINSPNIDINVVDAIGVRAVSNNGTCENISVGLQGCQATVNGVDINGMYRRDGISVHEDTNRVRIVVPNCADTDLVMWVFCMNGQTEDPVTEEIFNFNFIRFVVRRGLNLAEESHGLIGQFWNVPVELTKYTGDFGGAQRDDAYIITVKYPGIDARSFVGLRWDVTWEFERRPCLYVGRSQAGPLAEEDVDPNDSVIQGTYRDYRVDSMFSSAFTFSHFDEDLCPT